MKHMPLNQSFLARRGVPSAPGNSGEYRGVMLASLLMFVVGWGGLIYLIVNTRPRIGGEIWLFFILLQIAVTGSAIPFVRLFCARGQAVMMNSP